MAPRIQQGDLENEPKASRFSFKPGLKTAAAIAGVAAVAGLFVFPLPLFVLAKAVLAANLSSFVAAAYVNVVANITMAAGVFFTAAASAMGLGKIGSKLASKFTSSQNTNVEEAPATKLEASNETNADRPAAEKSALVEPIVHRSPARSPVSKEEPKLDVAATPAAGM